MKKITLILAVVVSFSSIAISQEGKPFVKVFANYNSSMEDDYAEFEIKRTYLGYSYKFADGFAAKVTLDVGKNSGGSQYTAFLKTASLNYKASDQLSLDLGMIGTKNFKFMEKAFMLVFQRVLNEKIFHHLMDALLYLFFQKHPDKLIIIV